ERVEQVHPDAGLVVGERRIVAEAPSVGLARARAGRDRGDRRPHERVEEDDGEPAGEHPERGADGDSAERRHRHGAGHQLSSVVRKARSCTKLITTSASSTMTESAPATPRSFCPWKATE